MPVYTVSDAYEFKDSVLEADPSILVFILFYNNSNEDMLGFVESLSEDPRLTRCKFHVMNSDESDELAEQYHVKHYPTCVMLKGGEIVAKVPTPRDGGVIREYVEKNL